jgi:hypothetical protein
MSGVLNTQQEEQKKRHWITFQGMLYAQMVVLLYITGPA